MSRPRLRSPLVVAALAACLAVAGASAAAAADGQPSPRAVTAEVRVVDQVAQARATAAVRARMRPAPRLANPSASGRALSARYFRLLQARDVPGLRTYLSSAFQVQRADGTAWSKGPYLRGGLPRITRFTLTRAVGTQVGPTLVVRYLARVSGITNGRPYSNAPAPRLSTFAWDGTAWRMTSHANFEPLPIR